MYVQCKKCIELTERTYGHTEHPTRGKRDRKASRWYRGTDLLQDQASIISLELVISIKIYNTYLYDHILYFTTYIVEDTTVLGDKT